MNAVFKTVYLLISSIKDLNTRIWNHAEIAGSSLAPFVMILKFYIYSYTE